MLCTQVWSSPLPLWPAEGRPLGVVRVHAWGCPTAPTSGHCSEMPAAPACEGRRGVAGGRTESSGPLGWDCAGGGGELQGPWSRAGVAQEGGTSGLGERHQLAAPMASAREQ